jgi:hypothetical protein
MARINKPNENQMIVEWFNNEIAVWRAKWDRPDKHLYIDQSSEEFYDLIEEAKEYEHQRNMFMFKKGFSLAEKMYERD